MYFIMKTLALVVQRYPFAYILYILHAKMMTFESEKSSVEMFATVYMIKKIQACNHNFSVWNYSSSKKLT
jgi:hypothetical protein